jgi:HEAT repeat protein
VLQHRKEFSYVIRWAAARSLGKINDQKAVEPLIAILIEESNTLRRGIIEALGQLRSEQAIDPLITFLRDEDSSIRGTVVEALGLIGSNRALPALNWVQQNDNGIYAYQRIREIAFEAIKSIELLQQGQELR